MQLYFSNHCSLQDCLSVPSNLLFDKIQQGNSRSSSKHFADDMSGPLSPMSLPAPKQLKFSPGIANGSMRESAAFLDQTQKVPVFSTPLLSCNFLCEIEDLSYFWSLGADGTNWTVINEETGNCRTGWEALEMEKESSPVATAI